HHRPRSRSGSRQLNIASRPFNRSSQKRRSVSISPSVYSARHAKSGALGVEATPPSALPHKRLTLTGGDRSKGNGLGSPHLSALSGNRLPSIRDEVAMRMVVIFALAL